MEERHGPVKSADLFPRDHTAKLNANIVESNDLWYDRDDDLTFSWLRLADRLEAASRCRSALVFLSGGYLKDPQSRCELKLLLERCANIPVYIITLPPLEDWIQRPLFKLPTLAHYVTAAAWKDKLAETCSRILGGLCELKMAQSAIIGKGVLPPDFTMGTTGNFKLRTISHWTPDDVQDWLLAMNCKEFYALQFGEQLIDGVSLQQLSDLDMESQLGIDSPGVRRALLTAIGKCQKEEIEMENSTRLQVLLHGARPRANLMYLVYDPHDSRLAKAVGKQLTLLNYEVSYHGGLGKSREEFIRINGATLLSAQYHLVLLTGNSVQSLFVLQELCLLALRGKLPLCILLADIWKLMTPHIRALTADLPTLGCDPARLAEALPIIDAHFRPLEQFSRVVFDQDVVRLPKEAVRPLAKLYGAAAGVYQLWHERPPIVVFCSHWSSSSDVQDLSAAIAHLPVSISTEGTVLQSPNEVSPLTSHDAALNSAQLAVLCVTAEYLRSDSFSSDLLLAAEHNKHIIALLLENVKWPPTQCTPGLLPLLDLVPVFPVHNRHRRPELLKPFVARISQLLKLTKDAVVPATKQ